MHPRGLRCSSFKYSRHSRSSRLAHGAPRRPRCDAGVSPRAASDRRPAEDRRELGRESPVVRRSSCLDGDDTRAPLVGADHGDRGILAAPRTLTACPACRPPDRPRPEPGPAQHPGELQRIGGILASNSVISRSALPASTPAGNIPRSPSRREYVQAEREPARRDVLAAKHANQARRTARRRRGCPPGRDGDLHDRAGVIRQPARERHVEP